MKCAIHAEKNKRTLLQKFTMPSVKILAVWILCTAIGAQCRTQNQPLIHGQISVSDAYNSVVYLVRPRSLAEIASGYAGVVVDSAIIDSRGVFRFEHLKPLEAPVFFQLAVQYKGNKYPTQLMDDSPDIANFYPFVLIPNQTVYFTGKADHLLSSGRISPPQPDNQAIAALISTRKAAHRALQYDSANEQEEDAIIEAATRKEQYRLPLIQFADTTSSFWAAMLALRWVSPDSDYERVPEFVHRQCRRWQSATIAPAFAAQICTLAAEGRLPLMLGDTMPNFALPTATGDTVFLYQLMGKRLTIIDLWASWCAPCRRENRDILQPAWTKYREKGLQIVGYALDSNAGPWKTAIQKDGALWPQASHLTGDSSPFLDMLRITTIPANFVLDQNGVIIAKNLHGSQLQAQLAHWIE